MKTQSRNGFALLLTLVLLALAGTVLATVARRAYAQVERADQAQADLQIRWAAATLRPLVEQAEQVLTPDGAEQANGLIGLAQPKSREIQTQLGGLTVSLTFADEQAKLPLHHVMGQHGPDEATRRLRSLLPAELATRVRPRPIDAFTARLNDLPPPPQTRSFQSFSQVLTAVDSDSGRLPEEDARLISDWVTLWGPGTLQVRSVKPEVLHAALAPDLDLSQARQLVLMGSAPSTLERVLADMALSDRAKRRLRGRLVHQSETYSLWITLRDDRRAYQQFIVRDHRQGQNVCQLQW